MARIAKASTAREYAFMQVTPFVQFGFDTNVQRMYWIIQAAMHRCQASISQVCGRILWRRGRTAGVRRVILSAANDLFGVGQKQRSFAFRMTHCRDSRARVPLASPVLFDFLVFCRGLFEDTETLS
jgi:hypothetical protein